MTAAVLSRSGQTPEGLRPINPKRDMAQVADLIETAFAGQLDPTGRRMVREMRAFANAGWLGWLAGRLLLPQAAHPIGFVWEEGERLVGNASLLTVIGYPERWVLANVAVHPEHRRRGIGRALVRASLDLARRRKGKVVLLQVQSDNLGAQALYASLGFRPLTTRTTWVRPASGRALEWSSPGLLRRRQREGWRAQWQLASRLHPEGLLWPLPLRENTFRPRLFDRYTAQHWVWREGDKLLASVTARVSVDRYTWRILLLVDPVARGKVEGRLLAQTLAELPRGHWIATLDYPAGLAVDDLQELGFRPEHELTWMKIEVG